ncbi:GntR family transcriptional regulator [Streptomyces sp. NPDC048521]|uniref:GntR family transcriptional regulator n=1 Tax=Streptomyces sp. NPDC048521 TaxID=3365566 RepID=UPI0037218971
MTGVPLKHQRISRILAREIRAGRRPAGERLPGEHALTRRFGVSRTTVRATLAELSEEGLITIRIGKGSSVLFDGRPPDDRLGRARALAVRGAATSARTLAVRETHDSALAAELGLEKDEFVCVERTRELVPDGTVVSYERGPGCGPTTDEQRTSRTADDSFAEHAVALLDPGHFRLSLAFG